MPELYRDRQARVLQNSAPEFQIFSFENFAMLPAPSLWVILQCSQCVRIKDLMMGRTLARACPNLR